MIDIYRQRSISYKKLSKKILNFLICTSYNHSFDKFNSKQHQRDDDAHTAHNPYLPPLQNGNVLLQLIRTSAKWFPAYKNTSKEKQESKKKAAQAAEIIIADGARMQWLKRQPRNDESYWIQREKK